MVFFEPHSRWLSIYKPSQGQCEPERSQDHKDTLDCGTIACGASILVHPQQEDTSGTFSVVTLLSFLGYGMELAKSATAAAFLSKGSLLAPPPPALRKMKASSPPPQ